MKKKVLIVEDNESSIASFQHELGDEFELTFGRSVAEAVAMFNNHMVDIVAIDACVRSRRPNVYGLIKFMRKTFTGPIIAISGSDNYRQLQLDAGCSHACPKANLRQTIVEIVAASTDEC